MSIQRAVIFSTLERYYGFVVSFIMTVVISRLLTPAEVGAFSVAMALAGVASCLREFGASAFLVRAAQLEKHHESCAFGLTLLLGGSLGCLMLALADPLASFFDQNDIATLLRILSINFFLLPFGTVNNALIQRGMHFDVVARISIVAMTLSSCVSVGLAWLGFGAFSLAWGAVVLASSSAVLSILWGPGSAFVMPQWRGAGELVRFGAQTTGLTVLWEIGSRYPDFILGKLQGFATAGILSRASGLAGNVNDLLLKGSYGVALSYFSQIQRDSGDPVKAHVRMATLVTGLGWPAFAGLAFFAEPLTLALYGEQWLEIVWPLRIICLQFCLGLPYCFQLQVIIVRGAMEKLVKVVLIALAFRLLAVTVGAIWGVMGVAVALVVTQLFGDIISSQVLWPAIGVCWRDYWKVVKVNLPITGFAILCCSAALSAGTYWEASYVQLILGFGLLAALTVVAGYFLLRHPLVEEGRALLKSQRAV